MSNNLKTFKGTVGSVITIKAKDLQEAEEKYDSHFWGLACPCKSSKCDCVNFDEDTVDHTLKEVSSS